MVKNKVVVYYFSNIISIVLKSKSMSNCMAPLTSAKELPDKG
jgi:hypothetical protein